MKSRYISIKDKDMIEPGLDCLARMAEFSDGATLYPTCSPYPFTVPPSKAHAPPS